jgi:hypothetical protein
MSPIRRFAAAIAITLALFWIGGCSTVPGQPRGNVSEEYRGFHADLSEVGSRADLEAIRAALREQLDLVCAVGVTPEVQDFFQHVPLRVLRVNTGPPHNPGAYSAESRTVNLNPEILAAGHKPVLLHELLHAFHHQKMPDSFGNPTVLAFYERAKATNAFAAKSHMLDNVKEYFACCATTYLFGVTAQEPFRREKVRSVQPEFYEFLRALFGPAAGQYAGFLEGA